MVDLKQHPLTLQAVWLMLASPQGNTSVDGTSQEPVTGNGMPWEVVVRTGLVIQESGKKKAG